jgi:DNA-3-methyladenine glycosylase I
MSRPRSLPASTPRCGWELSDPRMIAYHDEEWGVPLHDDIRIFEFLVLDAFQAGLSWAIVLRKREAFRRAFHDFDPVRVARMTPRAVERLLADPGIIRNRLKIEAAIANAGRFLAVQKEFGSFDRYLWGFVGGRPLVHTLRSLKEMPVTSPESDALSRDLKARGFKFVGSTICYAFLQAAGLINDHTVDCFRYRQVGKR